MEDGKNRVGTLEQRHAHAWLALAIGSLLEDLKENPKDKCLRRIGGVLVSDPAQEFGRQGTVCTSKALMAKDFIKKMGYVEEIVFKAVFSPASRNAYLESGGSMDLEKLTVLLKEKLAEYTTVDQKVKRRIAKLQEEQDELLENNKRLKTENARLGEIVNLKEEIRNLMAAKEQLQQDKLMLPVYVWENILDGLPPDHFHVGCRGADAKLHTQYLTRAQYVAWQISELYPEGDVARLSKRQKKDRLDDMEEKTRELQGYLSNVDSISEGLGKVMHHLFTGSA